MDRFWEKVKRTDTCWLWTAGKLRSGGYGQFELNGNTMRAHRLAWEMTNGPIPKGLLICHRCDNPACVNPAHLFLGTARDNNADCLSKGRRVYAPGEKHPDAKLTEKDVREIRALAASKQVSLRAMARRYGMAHSSVRNVVIGRTWRHVA